MAKVNKIIVVPSGGSAIDIAGASKVDSPSYTHATDFIQILGFNPLTLCDYTQCRTFEGNCYINKVFGKVNERYSTYENDFSTFFIDNRLLYRVFWKLQKLNEVTKVWDATYNITSSYGAVYSNGDIAGHTSYNGCQINWGNVITLHGSGYYRIKCDIIYPSGDTNCALSEMYILRPYSCDLADRTVKFEANNTGKHGSIDIDGYVFDLCNWTHYDSVRVPGFFGHETTQYDEILLEYQSGIIERVRDEAVQKFKFYSGMMPKYLHDRLKAYGFMANKTLVSDYNKNNSDYNIQQKSVVKAGGYEPKYNVGTRLANVVVDFKEGIEGVIKSTSCD